MTYYYKATEKTPPKLGIVNNDGLQRALVSLHNTIGDAEDALIASTERAAKLVAIDKQADADLARDYPALDA